MSDARPVSPRSRRLPFGLAVLVLLGALSTLASGELLTRFTIEGERYRASQALSELERAGVGPSLGLLPAPGPKAAQDALERVAGFVELSSSERAALALAGERLGLELHGDDTLAARVEELRALEPEYLAQLEGARARLGELEQAFAALAAADWSGVARSRAPLEVADEHLLPIFELRKQLGELAAAEALAGHRDEAWRLALLQAQLTRRQRDLSVLALMLRQVSADRCARVVGRLLVEVGAPPLGLRSELVSCLTELARPAPVEAAVRLDLTYAMSYLDAAGNSDQDWVFPPPQRYKLPFLRRIDFNRARTSYIELCGEVIRAVRRPTREALAELGELRAQPSRVAELPRRTMIDPVRSLLGEGLETRARLHLSLAALALCGADSTCGYGSALPAELPDPLVADPSSPFGAPVRYVRDTPQTGRLWCVGVDGRDEQGQGDDVLLKLDLQQR